MGSLSSGTYHNSRCLLYKLQHSMLLVITSWYVYSLCGWLDTCVWLYSAAVLLPEVPNNQSCLKLCVFDPRCIHYKISKSEWFWKKNTKGKLITPHLCIVWKIILSCFCFDFIHPVSIWRNFKHTRRLQYWIVFNGRPSARLSEYDYSN